MILVTGVEDGGEAALLTDDEMSGLSPSLVLDIKLALGLEIVFKLEYLAKSDEELGLTS